ncbi:MAG: hypothetical protein ABI284_04750 [Nitrosospira sp.]
MLAGLALISVMVRLKTGSIQEAELKARQEMSHPAAARRCACWVLLDASF